jgi:hypothetical protein
MILNKRLELAVMEFVYLFDIPLQEPRNFSSSYYLDRKDDLALLYDKYRYQIFDFCFANSDLYEEFDRLNRYDAIHYQFENYLIFKESDSDFDALDMLNTLFVIDTVINKCFSYQNPATLIEDKLDWVEKIISHIR